MRYRGGFKGSLSHGEGDAFNDAGDRYFGGCVELQLVGLVSAVHPCTHFLPLGEFARL